MESSYKPEGYNTVSPYLIVNSAYATIDFLVEVFGGVKLRQSLNDEGKLIHAEVRIDDTVVMLADGGDGWAPMPAHQKRAGWLEAARLQTAEESRLVRL
jgi:PhnB protein